MMRPEEPLLSIVIPVFNEERVLPALQRRLLAAVTECGVAWEVIFVDDGSSDETPTLLRALHESDSRLKTIALSRNFGHQIAVTAGLDAASGDAVALMDGDLQDPPEMLPQFLARWREGYDVVYGVRATRKGGVLKRACYSAFYRLLQLLADIEIPLDSGDFCLMDRQVVSALQRFPERRRFVRGLRAWVGFRQIGIPYDRPERAGGEPKYTWWKLWRLATDGVLSFSFKPLTMISVAGLLTAMFSFAGLLFFAVHRVVGFEVYGYSPADVPGFTSIIFSLLFFGGIQLLALGLIGRYIGQIAEEVKRRPLYIEKERLGFEVERR
jgi:polyisoprenyl-phosphate glycosyltransferase